MSSYEKYQRTETSEWKGQEDSNSNRMKLIRMPTTCLHLFLITRKLLSQPCYSLYEIQMCPKDCIFMSYFIINTTICKLTVHYMTLCNKTISKDADNMLMHPSHTTFILFNAFFSFYFFPTFCIKCKPSWVKRMVHEKNIMLLLKGN